MRNSIHPGGYRALMLSFSIKVGIDAGTYDDVAEPG